MITDFRDLRDCREKDLISVEGKIFFVKENDKRTGHSVGIEDGKGGKIFSFINSKAARISERDKGSMITLEDVEFTIFNGKDSLNVGRNTKIDLGGSGGRYEPRRDERRDDPPRRPEPRSEAPRASGGYGNIPYKSLQDMGFAWQLCYKQAQSDVKEFHLLNENAFIVKSMEIATSYFIEGNRSGLLQRLVVEEANRDASRVDYSRSRGGDTSGPEKEWGHEGDNDSVPY